MACIGRKEPLSFLHSMESILQTFSISIGLWFRFVCDRPDHIYSIYNEIIIISRLWRSPVPPPLTTFYNNCATRWPHVLWDFKDENKMEGNEYAEIVVSPGLGPTTNENMRWFVNRASRIAFHSSRNFVLHKYLLFSVFLHIFQWLRMKFRWSVAN